MISKVIPTFSCFNRPDKDFAKMLTGTVAVPDNLGRQETNLNFTNQFARCTKVRAKSKWCKRCCSISPKFLQKLRNYTACFRLEFLHQVPYFGTFCHTLLPFRCLKKIICTKLLCFGAEYVGEINPCLKWQRP